MCIIRTALNTQDFLESPGSHFDQGMHCIGAQLRPLGDVQKLRLHKGGEGESIRGNIVQTI